MNSRLMQTYIQDENSLRRRLIYLMTMELSILGFILIYFNMAIGLWSISGLLMCGSIAMLLNILLLSRTGRTDLCGHIVAGIFFLVMVGGNYLMGGTVTSYISWFIAMPVISAVTVGLSSIVFYALLSFVMIILFNVVDLDMSPLYGLTTNLIIGIDIVNVLLPLSILSTTVYFLLKEHNNYENLLKKNQLLLTEEKDKYQHLAQYDSLTKLANRANFQAHLQVQLAQAAKTGNLVTVFFMDLDGMKEVNDQYGHDSGDVLLLVTSKLLKSCLREEDLIARLGGDEFTAIITHPVGSNVPQQMAQRILTAFNRPLSINGHLASCGISIGIATYPQDGKNLEELLKAADTALYSVKQAGGQAYKASEITL